MKVKSAAAVIYQNVLEVFKHLSVTEKEEILESCFNRACLSHNEKKKKQLSLSRFHIMLHSKSFFLILRQLLELLKKKKR